MGHGNPELTARAQALTAVVTQYEAGLLRYAARLVRDPAAAEDVVQDTFGRLALAWQNGRQPSDRLRPWLYHVTHNLAVDHIRHESRRRRLNRDHAQWREMQQADAAASSARRHRQHAAVIAQLDRLSPAERQILLLRLDAGLSYAEIAAVTGRSRGNVGCLRNAF